ncbi:Vacuolar protein sorting-associated protein 41-like protein [Zancudomyces culisetae]|uniref:Vacuolar protein sorting-associated protein 41-like protein n=1 Tax=Zancudomyces culisetae TaxID=1213189 RepID=A0A1R1PEX1_ZANCU|nr:Vacuolar protein sorting-associated protein 41-like protein [Zancudomyces culisetae]|eukprot:OMH79514.1 Vacuolar protein sorting-associated protein 41-like protein [Zancudomyces culisetae]
MMLVHGGNVSKEVEMAVESERGDDADLEDNAPELRVVSKELEEITRDVLMVPGYETVIANQYRLISRQVDALGIGDNRWYVVSPKQIILVKEKTFSQHVEWLISQNQIEKAYKEITEGGSYDATELDVAKKQLEQVGKAYINILLEKRQFQEAAKAIKLILQQLNMHKDWEDYVYQFAAAGEIDKIVDYLPANKTISPIVYELVLGHLLDTDIGKFCKVLDKYDVDLFDAESVELAMLGKLRDNCENIELKRSLTELYDRSGRQDEAVLIYLELQDTGIIERIEKENLVFAVRNHAEAILKYDEKMVESKGMNNGNILNRLSTAPGVGLLVRNTAAITPNSVVTQLLTHPKHLHTYLHTLRVKSPDTMPTQYSDLQVELYAEYNSELLLHFLRTANNYDLVKACRICESRDLVNETIYLLGRMGDFRKALALILFELGDINQAISFATEQKDQDLWNDLVRFSASKDTENNTNSHLNIAGNDQIKAELFLALLTKADKKFVNPIRDLLGKLSDMANDMLVVNNNAHESEVAKRLPNAIKDLISQYQTNHDLGQLGYTSINSDLRSLIIKIYNKSNRGRRIDVENAVCNLCNTALLTTASPYRKAPASGKKIVKFLCNHSFHLSCLIPKKMLDKLDMKTSAPVSLRMNSSSPPFSESDNILNAFRYANQGYDGDQGRLYKLRSLIVNSSYHYASTFECPICCNNTIINNNSFAISVANTDSSVNTNTNAGAGAGAVVVSQSVTSTGGWVIPAKYLPNSNSFNLKAKNTATSADPSVLPDVKPLIF